MTVRTFVIPAAATLALLAGALVPASAQTNPGPALTVTASQVAKALACTDNISATSRRPILLIHGTTWTPKMAWSWNWVRTLNARNWPHCEIALPDNGNGDIQVAAEYVVRAIRTVSERAGGRRIDVVGHSQGGMITRWALKFWPDTRAKVGDLIGLASSNNGTLGFNVLCAARLCSAANWQQRRGSQFLTALNRGPNTWPGISYTQIATVYDELAVPYTTPYLPVPSGSNQVVNTTVQAVCPLEVVDHVGIVYSNAAWLIALDALTHRGPADLNRISRATCGRLAMPGVNPGALPLAIAKGIALTAQTSLTTPQLHAEPPLRRYAR